MPRIRARFAVLLVFASCLGAPLLAAQPAPSAEPIRPSKSVRGTLQAVDKRLGGVSMTTEDGKRLAWRFSPAVIAEVEKVALGAPMIVIYRQITPSEKRVTAVAFPGTASSPTYVNLTGGRVVLRGAAMVGETCDRPTTAPATESIIPSGGRAEVLDACWCCAPFGKTCLPSNRTGQGQAFLESCFE
jgi:hypothetical protein